MRIVHYTPNTRGSFPSRSPWTGLENEIESWLGAAFDGSNGTRQLSVNLDEDKDNAFVRADLPGVQRSDINIEIVDGVLTINASRKQKTSGGGEESVSFIRSVSVPDLVDADKVAAAYENGVLTVTLPKREEAKPKKVTVEVK